VSIREVESVDLIERWVEVAVKCLSLEQIAFSPQCGFSSRVGSPAAPQEAQW
jgi:methionine synthase II (cobalamin-independent)